MKNGVVGAVLAGLLTLSAGGVVWTIWKGPTGQQSPARPLEPRGESARPAVASGRPVAAEEPSVDLASLPLAPFAGFGQLFTNNVAEPYRYLGPGRDIDDDWSPDEVRIGLVGQFTGPAQFYGLAMRKGVDMALAEANAEGGYQGKKFVLYSRDDLFDMGANANAMVKLVFDDKVRAIIGAVHSGNTHVGVRIALKCEVPQITSISTDPTITEVQIPWAFRCLADDRQQGRALAAYLLGRKGYRRLVLLNQQSKYGRMGIIEIRSLARRLGCEILLQRAFAGGQQNFDGLVKTVSAVAPEAIVVWGLYREAALLVKALRAAGIRAPIVGGDGLVSPYFLEQAGPAAEGVVVAYPFNPDRDDDVCRDFVARYRRAAGETPDSFVAHGYDAARIVIASIRAAGLNRAKIRDAMAATKEFPGVTGPITFDGTGNLIGAVELAEVRGGKFVMLPEGADGAH